MPMSFLLLFILVPVEYVPADYPSLCVDDIDWQDFDDFELDGE
jgi:hypothetical protein